MRAEWQAAGPGGAAEDAAAVGAAGTALRRRCPRRGVAVGASRSGLGLGGRDLRRSPPRPPPRSRPRPRCCPPRPRLREGGGELPPSPGRGQPAPEGAGGRAGAGREVGGGLGCGLPPRGSAGPGRGGVPAGEKAAPGGGTDAQLRSVPATLPKEAGPGSAAKPGGQGVKPAPARIRYQHPEAVGRGCPVSGSWRDGSAGLLLLWGLQDNFESGAGAGGFGRRSSVVEFARTFVIMEITLARLPLRSLQGTQPTVNSSVEGGTLNIRLFPS